MNKLSGIYKITNLINKKVYIGSSINLKKRLADHKSALKHDRHKNKHLQSSVEKHNINNFKFEIIELTIHLIKMENYYIARLRAANPKFGYNHMLAAYSCVGYKHTDEARANMSKAALGKKKSPEHCVNIAKSMIGNNRGKRRIDT